MKRQDVYKCYQKNDRDCYTALRWLHNESHHDLFFHSKPNWKITWKPAKHSFYSWSLADNLDCLNLSFSREYCQPELELFSKGLSLRHMLSKCVVPVRFTHQTHQHAFYSRRVVFIHSPALVCISNLQPAHSFSFRFITSNQIRPQTANKSAFHLLNEWCWWPTSMLIKLIC